MVKGTGIGCTSVAVGDLSDEDVAILTLTRHLRARGGPGYERFIEIAARALVIDNLMVACEERLAELDAARPRRKKNRSAA